MKALLASRALVRAAAREDREGRLEEDGDVEPDRPVLDVVEVEPHEIVEGEVRAARDLPEAGDPRQHEVALPVPVVQPLIVADRERARADEAHLAAEDVQELRQLVERELAE